MHAIFASFALVAYRGNYDVAKVDVKGAYIQTEITGSPIYMKMDKRLTSIILSILPSLQAYVDLGKFRNSFKDLSMKNCVFIIFS
jgi:hypothetical protein